MSAVATAAASIVLSKCKQIIKNGFSACKNSFYVKTFRLPQKNERQRFGGY